MATPPPPGKLARSRRRPSPSPAGAYGRSKLEAEHGLRALENERFRVTILRPMMVFGTGCKGNYNALAALARRAPLFPDFPNRRGMVYIDDLAELIRRLIDDGRGRHLPPADLHRLHRGPRPRRRQSPRPPRPLPRFLNAPVRMLGKSGTVRRAFGGFYYREDMADHGFAPGTLTLEDCVARTEEGHG